MFETKFENGTDITNYLACAYVEEFCEGEPSSFIDKLRAYSYICGKKLHTTLQGFYGRNIQSLIDNEIMDENGKLNWEYINELI